MEKGTKPNPKWGIKKGDKILARTSAAYDEQGNRLGGHEPYEKPLTVTKAFYHGVRTRERGYIHNNNILSKVEENGKS